MSSVGVVSVLATPPATGVSRRRALLGYAWGTVGTAAMALLLWALPGGLPLQALLMLTVVVAAALIGGLRPAVVAALVGGITLDVVFVAPTGSLAIADPLTGAALVIFVLIGTAVATVVDRSARLAALAVRARAEADVLSDLARRLLHGPDQVEDVLDQARHTLGVDRAAVWVEDEDGAPPATAYRTRIEDGVWLVLSAAPATDRPALLDAYAGHLQVLRERRRADERARLAAELAEGNRIRTALLAAVSHDLRTPLAAIKAAATSLRSTDVVWSAADEAELLATIEEGADRLERLVANLLDLTRLQTGAVTPLSADVEAADLVDTALEGLDHTGRLEVAVTEGLLLRADPGLAERVLANLIDNALRYAPGAPVRVGAERVSAETVAISVCDHGPGVPDADLDRLFQPFQRLGDAPGDSGLGLGLAVALGLTETMGGRLSATDTPGGGLTMTLTLPAAGTP